ncbi:MAG: hypothetical protein AB7S26_35530 [Sandaracinaceae bacterium]
MFTVRSAHTFAHVIDGAAVRSPHIPRARRRRAARALEKRFGPLVAFEEQDVMLPTADVTERWDHMETLVWAIPDGLRGRVRALYRVLGAPPLGFALPFARPYLRFVMQLKVSWERAPEVQRLLISSSAMRGELTPLAGRAPGAPIPLAGDVAFYAGRFDPSDDVPLRVDAHRGAYVFVVDGAVEIGQPGMAVDIAQRGDEVELRGPSDAWLHALVPTELLVLSLPVRDRNHSCDRHD